MADASLKEQLAKNIGFNFIRIAVNRVGGLIFTIILARLLLPELFGLYSIVMSVVVILATLADLGVNTTVIKYVSFWLGKNNKDKARQYFKFFFKVKIGLVLATSVVLLALAQPLAVYFFGNPTLIFLLLIAVTYIIIVPFQGFAETLFYINQDVKHGVVVEVIHQVSRITLAIVAIYVLSGVNSVWGIFLGMALAGALMISYTVGYLFKKCRYLFDKVTKWDINKKEAYKFFRAMTIASLGLVVFVSIDTIMLGRYVSPEYIGFYRAAFSIAITASALLNLLMVVFPVFSQLKLEKLRAVFNGVVKYLLLLAIPAVVGVIIVGQKLITLIYGVEYASALLPLYVLSVLVIINPLAVLYMGVLQSRGRAAVTAKIIVVSLIINIVLNYVFITWFLIYGGVYAIMGAAVATVISNILWLIFCVFFTKRKLKFGFSLKGLIHFIKPAIASIVMGVVVYFYLSSVNNSGLAVVGVIIGMIVYVLVLYLVRGIGKEDTDTIRSMLRLKRPDKA